MGCSGGLALAIAFVVRTLLTTEAAPYIGNMMMPSGAASEALPQAPAPTAPDQGQVAFAESSTWREALSLPDNSTAPECLRKHVKDKILTLLNIGKKNAVALAGGPAPGTNSIY